MDKVSKSANNACGRLTNSQNIYTVNLIKREQTGFGFLLQQRDEIPYFRIWELCKNGAAEDTNRIHKGDLLIKVNNYDLTTMSYEKGLEYIKSIKPGSNVTLTLLSAQNSYYDQINESIGHTHRKSNGFMSPLMKIKKKIHACTSPSSTSNHQLGRKLYSSNLELEQCEKPSLNELGSPSQCHEYSNSSSGQRSKFQFPILNGYATVARTDKANIESLIDKNIVRFQTPKNGNNNGQVELDLINSLNDSHPVSRTPDLKKKQMNFSPPHIESHDAPTVSSISSLSMSKEIMIELSNDLKCQQQQHVQQLQSTTKEIIKDVKSAGGQRELKNRIRTAGLLDLDINTPTSSFPFQNVDSEANNDREVDSSSIHSNYCNIGTEEETEEDKDDFEDETPSEIMGKESIGNGRTKQHETQRSKSNNIAESMSKNNAGIQIIQNGDEICINIDGKIEILTNRSNDRKIISMSPQVRRRCPVDNSNQKKSDTNNQEPPTKYTSKIEVDKNNRAVSTPVSESNANSFDLAIPFRRQMALNDESLTQRQTREEISQTENNETKNNQQNTTSSSEISDIVKEAIGEPELQPQLHKKVMESKCPFIRASSQSSNLNHSVDAVQKAKKKKGVKLKYLLDETTTLDTLFHKSITKITCNDERCTGSMMLQPGKQDKSREEISEEAVDFINQFYASVKREDSKQHKERLVEVLGSIEKTGTYELKETELNFGARTAWRNASKCIGRIQWSKLQVFDARYVTTARGMFECICNHLKYVFNKGNIRSAITIFRAKNYTSQNFRVWNPQFLSYAGFQIDDQTIIGDRANIEFTTICMKLGWKPKFEEFEILPLVLQASGQDPEFFELPTDLSIECELSHPKYEWFKELGLKWYCVPGVSGMALDVGGLVFTACPFNGWYMQTEIARDLADINRYNKLPIIAERMGLDTKTNSSLWKDKALLELNYAILYSFQKGGVTITDHHSASESFMKHYENENKLRGGCPGDWVWIVPPMSSHLSPVFHLEMLNYSLKPSYEYQDPAWKTHVWKEKNANGDEKSKRKKRKVYFSDIARAVKFSAKLMGKALAKRVKCTILYATETGKSERFAKNLAEIFNHAFDSKIFCMNDYDVANLEHESLLLIVTSTFGNGDPPENGEEFKKYLYDMKKENSMNKTTLMTPKQLATQNSIFDNSGSLQNVRFGVFGLGNSSYPKFCSYGKFLDTTLSELGAECIYEIGLGDELCGQEDAFRKWSVSAFKSALDAFCIDIDLTFIESISEEVSWSPQNIRLMVYQSKQKHSLCENLSKLHNRNVLPCKLKSRKNLQSKNSGRVTLCVELNTGSYAGEMAYKAGDHVGLFANNRKELVDMILSRVTNAPPSDQLVQVEILKEKTTVFGVNKNWIVDDRYPPCTLFTALTNFLDITSTVSQNMLQYFSTQTSSEIERQRLENLAKDPLEYEKWRLNGHNLVEVLEEFPSLRPNASLLMTQLPKLQARFYSISSSPKLIQDDIHITLGVVEYQPEGKSMHYGVCSKWLEESDVQQEVPVFIRGAPSFRMPEDKTLPIILVGAGTGIAPFRSFWQERMVEQEMNKEPTGENGTGWGEIVIYFGCRHSDQDELYRSEIDQMISKNVIKSYYPAFSRKPGQKKTYVQHMVERNSLEVFNLIFNKKGHFYICGDVRMAADVTKTLENCLRLNGLMSLEDSRNYISEMKENLRFHEDIFGNSSSKFYSDA